MKISRKTYYGLRAVLCLAQENGPLSIQTIAEREELPHGYLEKVLQGLRKAGIVEAKKGTAGGYALAKPAEALSAWEVISALDGHIKIFSLPEHNKKLPASKAVSVAAAGWPCPPHSHCQTNEVLRALDATLEESLSKISVGSLASQQNSR
ncbi:MAG: hypothetical protein A2808_02740 [Candidatus Moranbacteria bacterium RIFCSPHIGHO2_01_FULL_55_24]|nr:MAG: hypothetical protein A2808_02740 [Candidatus Moranbacteria bacterium RIFCSPHIGHO2_01_FULL_55_24]